MINYVCKGDDGSVLLDEGGGWVSLPLVQIFQFLAAVQAQLVFNFPKIK